MYKRQFIDRDRVRYGYQASAVPGTVAGLLKAHELYGKLPLKKIMEPVLRQAKNGIVVSFDLHHAINSTPQLLNDRESKKIYFSGDSPVPINSKLVLDDLHQTLKLIAQKGKAGFYEGITAKRIASAMKQNNGFITSNDLKKYEAKVSKPISTKYRDKIIFTHGPPSGGGIALLSALNVIENYDFKIDLGSLVKFFYKEKINNAISLFKINNNKINELVKIKKSKLNVGIAWSGSFYGPNEPYRLSLIHI